MLCVTIRIKYAAHATAPLPVCLEFAFWESETRIQTSWKPLYITGATLPKGDVIIIIVNEFTWFLKRGFTKCKVNSDINYAKHG